MGKNKLIGYTTLAGHIVAIIAEKREVVVEETQIDARDI
jgi:hypothetical protein